jgi:single-stranded-DNA-specific exonuclease
MKVNLVNENFQSNYLKQLLTARGVTDIEKYLHPDASCLNDPLNLNNIKQGAIWLEETLNKENSHILLIIDCDVDGFTSSAIMYNYIKAISPNQKISYMLHEHKEHGLQDHTQTIIDSNEFYDLIILPDSSSNDYEYHEALKEHGMRCLVLDHHEIDDDQPISDNACIINNQLSPKYLNKELTGAGVTWQFCRCHESLNTSSKKVVNDLIDLAALGVCGDMGSVLNLENRYIMLYGFNHVKNYFFRCAIEKQAYSMNNEVTPISVAFYIVPMMNAMIRMGSMEEKERLFLGLIDGHRQVPCNKRGAKGTMEEVAIESLRECTNAKAKQNRLTDQMVSELEQKIFKYDLLENKILFIRLNDDDEYPSEVTGLTAMKLAAKYKRPTILARLNEEGYDRGSIRNVADCELQDLKKFLNDSGYFEWVQGHANAAGASILDSNLRAFHEYANKALKDINFNEGMYDVNFIREPNASDLEDLIYDLASNTNIWGQGNPEALIFVPNIYLDSTDYKVIGTNKDTVRFEKNGVIFIKFHASDLIEQLGKCNEIKISVVGKPNINKWMNTQSAQLLIEDYEVIDNLLTF